MFKTLKNLVTSLATEKALESIIRFSARRTADIVYYSVPVFRDPRAIAAGIVVRKIVKHASKNYKRVDFDPRTIFEDSIDAVSEAY